MLYAFDLLELDGVDYRPLPLGERKNRLARLVDRRLAGIAMNNHTDARGELVFLQACRMRQALVGDANTKHTGRPSSATSA